MITRARSGKPTTGVPGGLAGPHGGHHGGGHHGGHHGGGGRGGGFWGPTFSNGWWDAPDVVVVDTGPSADEAFMQYLKTLKPKERAKALQAYLAAHKGGMSGLGSPYIASKRGTCCDDCTCPGCCPLPIKRFHAGLGGILPDDAMGTLMIAGALLIAVKIGVGLMARRKR